MSGPVVTARVETFPIAGAWTISRGSIDALEVVTVEARMDGHTGRGECRPYPRYGWTSESVVAEIEAAAPEIATRSDPADWDLAGLMPADAARNALDCALWDLRAKIAGRPVWQLAGLGRAPGPVVTAYTLSLDAADAMREKAQANAHRPLLKVKLGGEGDLARLHAVREGAPESRIIVDANEGWSADAYAEIAPAMVELGVAMVEQPLPEGEDEALAGVERPLPVCADESCHDRASLAALRGRYDMINIKLDKTGGLTEALALKAAAEELGFRVMAGSMLSTSLAIAPAVLVAQGAEIADLDGPLLLARDRETALTYDEAGVHPAMTELWG
ncbi:MAG TPA: N-acetyl-D-Glu racemase DgcA [Thermohalobaculum sp.]|nr:N-acetyl-D-Glu racemase DgcA [Thermohalobaculum sp.]